MQDAQKREDEEREKLKVEWCNLIFTNQSVAAGSPEGPLPTSMESGTTKNPSSLIVWIGDSPKADQTILKALDTFGACLLSVAWSEHPAAEAYVGFDMQSPEVLDGTFYLRDRHTFQNQDLDMLHDVELLGRALAETLESKLQEYSLDWTKVVIAGFGKGAGIAVYASLLKLFPKQLAAMILFSPVVVFPSFLGEKITQHRQKSDKQMVMMEKMFTIWGSRNRSTPKVYRELLAQMLRRAPDVQCTPDNSPEGDHIFDAKSASVLNSLLPLCIPHK